MSICKNRGWGKRSEKLFYKKSGKYYQRTNIIAGYVNHKVIAPIVFNDACNTELIEAWGRAFFNQGVKAWSNCDYG